MLVVGKRAWMVVMAGALGVAGVAVASADAGDPRPTRRVAATARSPGSFTPAAADPRLAAMFARGGFDAAGFRFTPAGSGRAPRAVTLAVRARTARGDSGRVAAAPNVGIAPIAYSLGASVGVRRVTIAGDVQRIDLARIPGGRESADVAVTYAGSRLSGRVKGVVERPFKDLVPVTDDTASYSLDASTSYSLTRNLNVTAGVRYRTDRERLARSTDDRRDSQAVYVGTAFRF